MGTAQATPYTSPEIIANYYGNSRYAGWATTDPASSYLLITQPSSYGAFISGSKNIGDNASLLDSIDKLFSSLYQVDSITINVKAKIWSTSSWWLLLGDVPDSGGYAAELRLADGLNTFTLSESMNTDAFKLAAAGDPFQFRFKESSGGRDSILAYYVSAVVSYSDKPAAVPLPGVTSRADLGRASRPILGETQRKVPSW
ncbi:hypothetical protein, partial [Thiorhodococcus mannitoliphagus]|uniref:hypothetical protein n=1 Tax=Thiorhodococcus mannitoliphagus TaxID=329406 RepID=UPI00197D47F6